MFKKIVCATDFSPSASVAARYAASLARTRGGAIELVHAWTWQDELDEYAVVRPEVVEDWKRARDAKIAKAVDELSATGVTVTGRRVDGAADRAIVAHAAAVQADLLVTGTESRRGLAHALLGSVAERIVRTSEVPVLAVPRTWSVAADARFSPRAILVPIEVGVTSADVLRAAVELARGTDARIVVLHALVLTVLGADPAAARAAEAETSKRLAHWVEATAPEAASRIERIVRRGEPFAVIEEVAKEREVDLIAMATAGRTGIDHFMLGSVTERALRSLGRPVLTFRRSA